MGGACNPKVLQEFADAKGVPLYFDSTHAFGCTVDAIPIGNFGRAEVFSFHAGHILNAIEGGCICTNDNNLAVRLRSIRPSYGENTPADIARVANAQMSEAQAAIALMSLEDFPANQKNNKSLYKNYAACLAAIPGIYLVRPTGVSFTNYQCVVCTVDEREFGLSRDLLLDVLKAENVYAQRYFYPGLHRSFPNDREPSYFMERLPNTDTLCASCIQLPIGGFVSAQSVERICNMLFRAHHASSAIRRKLNISN